MNVKSSKLQDGTKQNGCHAWCICEYDHFTRCHFISTLSMIVQVNVVLNRTVVVMFH